MKVVDAIWEKKNLDVDCVEILIEPKDTPAEWSNIANICKSYSVLKVPSTNIAALSYAQEQGFRLIEVQFDLVHRLRNIMLPKEYEKFSANLTYREAAADDCEYALQRVREGNVFDADRISLDPAFSTKLAGRRYANFMDDMLKQGHKMTIAEVGKDRIGFSLTSVHGTKMVSTIAGVFPEYKGSGLGFSVIYFPIKEASALAINKLTASVSSNNLPSLRVHLCLGYEILRTKYVLVKHL